MPKFFLTVAMTAFLLAAAHPSTNAQTQAVKTAPALATRVMAVASKACTACESALTKCNKKPPFGNDRICASDYYDCIGKNHCKQ